LLLEKALQSVFQQKFHDFEIIVVDDCSTDETFDFLSQYKAKDTITLIRNEHNLGLQKSLNKGLEYATGEFIARIDDDDLWIDEEKLKKQYDYLTKNPKVILLGTAFKTDEGHIYNPQNDVDIRNQILFRCPFQHSTVMFKRIIDNQALRYNENLNYAEDWELWLKLGKYGTFVNLSDVTTYIKTEDNLSKEYFVKQHKQNLRIIQAYASNYPRSTRANLYQRFVFVFFKLFPVNGRIHNFFKLLFRQVFKT